jgi:hypothetical protein
LNTLAVRSVQGNVIEKHPYPTVMEVASIFDTTFLPNAK